MKRKAKFIGAYSDNRFGKGWEHTELEYEYRGHRYFVTKDNNGCMGEPLWSQHQREQDNIDYAIEHESAPHPEWKYEGSAQEGFDLFWSYIEGNDE